MKKTFYILKGLWWIEDTFIWIEQVGDEINYADQNFNKEDYLAVTTQNYDQPYIFIRRHSIIKIYTKKFEAQSIKLDLYIRGGTPGIQPFEIYKCNEDVDIRTVTWNTRPSNLQKIKTKYINPQTDEKATIDIKQLLEETWQEEKNELILYLKHGWEWKQNTDAFDISFFSTEAENEQVHPQLVIEF